MERMKINPIVELKRWYRELPSQQQMKPLMIILEAFEFIDTEVLNTLFHIFVDLKSHGKYSISSQLSYSFTSLG